MPKDVLLATLELYLSLPVIEDHQALFEEVRSSITKFPGEPQLIELALMLARKIGHIDSEERFKGLPTIIIQTELTDTPAFAKELHQLLNKYTVPDTNYTLGSNITDDNDNPIFLPRDNMTN